MNRGRACRLLLWLPFFPADAGECVAVVVIARDGVHQVIARYSPPSGKEGLAARLVCELYK